MEKISCEHISFIKLSPILPGGREILVSLLIIFFGTLAFGAFAGLISGISAEKTAGRDIVLAMLGGGLITQVLTTVGGVNPDFVGAALGGFGLGGVLGVAFGIKYRPKMQRALQKRYNGG